MKLVLKKDTLAELTTGELAQVRAGAPAPLTPSCPLFLELREKLSELAC